jgi:glycosyltransferase involved in cell wall biosynthesis
MRVAFVAPRYPPDVGGIETVLGELTTRLVQAGDHVEVFTHASPESGSGSETRRGVVVHRFRVPLPHRDLSVAPGLLRALARARGSFDVVHAHNYHASPALSAAVARVRPIVFTPYYHGGGHSQLTRLVHLGYRPLSRFIFAACAHIVCISASEAEALQRDMPSITTPISVIPIGVDTDVFAEARPFADQREVVLAVARMDAYKQLDRTILATRDLPERFQTVLIGDGPERARLESLTASLGLTSRVQMLGRLPADDLRRWFRTAKVVVSMSLHESFGLTVAESLAAGAPVVASSIPAHCDTARAQPPGAVRLLPPDCSPRALADAIVAAADAGLPTNTKIASWDEVTGQMRNIYRVVADF